MTPMRMVAVLLAICLFGFVMFMVGCWHSTRQFTMATARTLALELYGMEVRKEHSAVIASGLCSAGAAKDLEGLEQRFGRIASYRIIRLECGPYGLPVEITMETVRNGRTVHEWLVYHPTTVCDRVEVIE